jgi:cyclic pyranopterin phosphate synthase
VRALPVLDAHAERRVEPRSVRLSLTDRCDLACVYCRPNKRDGYCEETLDLAAFTALLQGLYAGGVRRVRLTGGEPLLSPIVVDAVRALHEVGFDDVALTTNGTRLAKLAAPLHAAGLMRVNVSLDTLDPERFARLTRGGRLSTVLAGIEAMATLPFAETKLNVVVVRGENEDELEALTRFAWDRGMTPRFLEIMGVGEGARIPHKLVPYAEQRATLSGLLEADHGAKDVDRGPARYVRARPEHGPHRIGFITGTTDTYCDGCDRLRVAADGTLRPCLATNDGVAAGAEAARGDLAGVRARLAEAWTAKPDGVTFRGCTEPSAREVSIRSIGG